MHNILCPRMEASPSPPALPRRAPSISLPGDEPSDLNTSRHQPSDLDTTRYQNSFTTGLNQPLDSNGRKPPGSLVSKGSMGRQEQPAYSIVQREEPKVDSVLVVSAGSNHSVVVAIDFGTTYRQEIITIPGTSLPHCGLGW